MSRLLILLFALLGLLASTATSIPFNATSLALNSTSLATNATGMIPVHQLDSYDCKRTESAAKNLQECHCYNKGFGIDRHWAIDGIREACDSFTAFGTNTLYGNDYQNGTCHPQHTLAEALC